RNQQLGPILWDTENLLKALVPRTDPKTRRRLEWPETGTWFPFLRADARAPAAELIEFEVRSVLATAQFGIDFRVKVDLDGRSPQVTWLPQPPEPLLLRLYFALAQEMAGGFTPI